GMYAYSAILTALFMRQRTGQGTTIEVSLFEALGEWMGYPAYYTKYGGKVPARTGAAHAAIAPYGPFESGDQKRVSWAFRTSASGSDSAVLFSSAVNWPPIHASIRDLDASRIGAISTWRSKKSSAASPPARSLRGWRKRRLPTPE